MLEHIRTQSSGKKSILKSGKNTPSKRKSVIKDIIDLEEENSGIFKFRVLYYWADEKENFKQRWMTPEEFSDSSALVSFLRSFYQKLRSALKANPRNSLTKQKLNQLLKFSEGKNWKLTQPKVLIINRPCLKYSTSKSVVSISDRKRDSSFPSRKVSLSKRAPLKDLEETQVRTARKRLFPSGMRDY